MKGKNIFRLDNIAAMYLSVSVAMILTEVTSVVAILMDGIITSRYLGVDAYSGISLLRPFSSVVLMIAGFFSTSCNILCTRRIGSGDKASANEVFNLTAFLALAAAALLIAAGFFFPTTLLRLCGVPLHKHPELAIHMYSYLRGYILGLPALMLLQIMFPILILDNGKKIFIVSSIILGAANIAGDLLNIFVFRNGAFGMGVATSVGYIIQFLVVCYYLIRTKSYFRLSRKAFHLSQLPELIRAGSPALVKKCAGTLRDIVTNYFNVILSLTTAAIAAKGIQGDLFQFLFCIPTGLGRALIAMVGIYYGANDRHGLTRLYTYALRLGFKFSAVAAAITFLLSPVLTRIYSADPEVISLTLFSIRWMSVALLFDTTIVLIQHYLQGTNNRKRANILSFSERLIFPVGTALILGSLYGSKGILASAAISKILLLLCIFAADVIRCKGFPKYWYDVMFLPKDFGGAEEDNMYAEIRNNEDVSRESQRTQEFCLQHGAGEKASRLMGLFVEEMTVNVLDHAKKVDKKHVYVDFRLFTNGNDICFSIMDLSDRFDPTLFYELNKDKNDGHLGIRLVLEQAKEVRYFSAFNGNNLIVYLDLKEDRITA